MTDLAQIGLAYDPSGAKAAVAGLQAMVPPAEKAQKAADKTAASMDKLDSAADKFAAAAAGLVTATASLSAALDRQSKTQIAAASATEQGAAAMVGAAASAGTLGTQMTALSLNYGKSFTASVGFTKQLSSQNVAAASAGASMQQLDAHVDAYRNNVTLMALATNGAATSLKQFDSHVKLYRDSLADVAPAANTAVTGINRVTAAANDNAGAMKANTGNIAAQFQDIGVTAAMGMNPLLIALQQGTQLSAVFAQSGASLGATLIGAFKSVLSPVSLLTIALVAASAYIIQMGIDMLGTSDKAATLADKLDKVKFSSNALSDIQGILGNVMDITTGKINTQSTALIGLARAQLLVAKLASQARAAEAQSKITASANDYSYELGGGMGGGISVDRKRSPTWQIESQFRNGVINYDQAVQGLQRMNEAGMITTETFSNLASAYANLGVERENQKLFVQGDKLLSGDMSAAPGLIKPGTPKKTPKGPKSAGEKFSDLAGGVQRDIALLDAQTKGLDLTADAALRLENQQKLLNDATAKGIPLTDGQRSALAALADQLTDAQIKLRNAQGFKEISEGMAKQLTSLQQAGERIGKYGTDLARLTAVQDAMNEATAKNVILTEQQKAAIEGKADAIAKQAAANARSSFLDDAAKGAEEAQAALERERGELGLTGAALAAYRYETDLLADARRRNITLDDEAIAGIKATAAAYGEARAEVDNLRTRLDALNGVMGASGSIGKLLGALTSSDPTSALLGMGGIGSIAGLATKGGRESYQKQADTIAKSISEVFGVGGAFAKTLAGAVQGSSLGSLGGSALGLNNGGSAIGGALGGALMSGGLGKSITKGLTGALGEALGGALSSAIPVLGGIAGGLLGSLLKKDKYGSAVVGNGGINSMGGNNSDSRSGANQIATTLSTTLAKLADSLDTTLGQFAVSIGVTNGKINVNPGSVTGMIGTTKQSDTIDFGEDQAAALKYAIQNAISDGALAGLSEGVKNFLLYNPNDFEGQLQKVLNLKGAQDELSQRKDGQSFDLKALDKVFAELRETAYRTGEGIADIEELYGLKRQGIIEQYASDATETERTRLGMEAELLRLSGDDLGALNIARKLERDELDASLTSLYDSIAAKQDEITANEKLAASAAEAAAAGNRIIDLQIRLSKAQGNDMTALALERMQEINAAQSEQERSMLRSIYATEDAAAAQTRAAEAGTMFANIVQGITDKFYEASKGLRDYADALSDQNEFTDAAVLKRRVTNTMEKAARGDQDAIASLPGLIDKYLPTAQRNATGSSDYLSEVAYLQKGLNDIADINEANGDKIATIVGGYFSGNLSPNTSFADSRINAGLASLQSALAADAQRQRDNQKTQIRQMNEVIRYNLNISEGGYGIKTQPVPTAENDA